MNGAHRELWKWCRVSMSLDHAFYHYTHLAHESFMMATHEDAIVREALLGTSSAEVFICALILDLVNITYKTFVISRELTTTSVVW